jgi:hypothetical protein
MFWELVDLALVVALIAAGIGLAMSSRARWIVLLGPVVIGLAGLAWHKAALRHFSGDTLLVYGYFEDAAGALTRPWVITMPWTGVIAALVLFSAWATLRYGLRGNKAAAMTSWLWSAIVLAAFSVYMAVMTLQGDAAVFI